MINPVSEAFLYVAAISAPYRLKMVFYHTHNPIQNLEPPLPAFTFLTYSLGHPVM